jgi:hypothetical protein
MQRINKRPAALILTVGICCIAVAATAVMATAGDRPSLPPMNAQAEGVGPVTGDLYGVFASRRSSRDQLPGVDASGLRGDGSSMPLGIDAKYSHRSSSSRAHGNLWVAPAANDSSCLLFMPESADAPAMSCGESKDVPNVNYTVSSATDVDIYGLVPDGYSSVTISLADGSEVTADVSDNVFGAHATSLPTNADFQGENGGATIDLG